MEKHKEYIRLVKGSRFAILLVHGFAGTPAHFRDLLPVIPATWSVCNILLDGHGGNVRAFGKSSMKRWKAQFCGMLDMLLAQHEKVLIVAHSMGTLFAIRAAVDMPERIAGLFLLAVPLRPRVKLSTVFTALRVMRGNIASNDKCALAMRQDTAIQIEGQLWNYVGWIPRLAELLAEIVRVQRILPQLAVPCQCFQSQEDELVSVRSAATLQNYTCIQNTMLYESGHFAYGPLDMKLLQTRLAGVIGQMEQQA